MGTCASVFPPTTATRATPVVRKSAGDVAAPTTPPPLFPCVLGHSFQNVRPPCGTPSTLVSASHLTVGWGSDCTVCTHADVCDNLVCLQLWQHLHYIMHLHARVRLRVDQYQLDDLTGVVAAERRQVAENIESVMQMASSSNRILQLGDHAQCCTMAASMRQRAETLCDEMGEARTRVIAMH